MKTIKEFFPSHCLKDKYDLELPQFTAEDIESYTIHVLKSLAEGCQDMNVKEKDPDKDELGRRGWFVKLDNGKVRFVDDVKGMWTVYAVPKQTIINKINNIW